MPSGLRKRCAPSRHSGDSSLSPNDPSSSLTCSQGGGITPPHRKVEIRQLAKEGVLLRKSQNLNGRACGLKERAASRRRPRSAHQNVCLLGGSPRPHVARDDGHQVVPALESNQMLAEEERPTQGYVRDGSKRGRGRSEGRESQVKEELRRGTGLAKQIRPKL
jgi:hypothetical protein